MTMTGFDYLATMTEAQFQNQVERLMDLYRWRWYHTHDSRRSPAGFLDIVALRDGLMIVAELKRQNGHTTKPQDAWITDFEKVATFASNVIVRLWRPSDLPGIEKLLKTGWKVRL